MARLAELELALQRRYPGLSIDLGLPGDHYVSINRVRVSSKAQGQGIGSAVVQAVQAFARGEGMMVGLTPCADRGHKAQLDRFYRRHGFVRNSGPGAAWTPVASGSWTDIERPSGARSGQTGRRGLPRQQIGGAALAFAQ